MHINQLLHVVIFQKKSIHLILYELNLISLLETDLKYKAHQNIAHCPRVKVKIKDAALERGLLPLAFGPEVSYAPSLKLMGQRGRHLTCAFVTSVAEV